MKNKSSLRRRLLNKLAERLVMLGGLSVIFSVLGIFLVILLEVWPLFRGMSLSKPKTDLQSFHSAATSSEPSISEFQACTNLQTIEANNTGFRGFSRKTAAREVLVGFLSRDSSGVATSSLCVLSKKSSKNLLGQSKSSSAKAELELDFSLGLLAISPDAESLVIAPKFEKVSLEAAPKIAELYWYAVGKTGSLSLVGEYRANREASLTAVTFVKGSQTLIIGDSAGGLRSLLLNRNKPEAALFGIEEVAEFKPHSGPITALVASERNRAFVSASKDGSLGFHYSTGGLTRGELKASEAAITSLEFNERADLLKFTDALGQTAVIVISDPHPDAALPNLFKAVRYEGYGEATHVWQSSSGSDEFEPKLGLWVLIFGSLKGTFYGLLFAVPIAVLAAIYTAEFMSPRFRAVVKPIVELMAALPSVVVGFVAGIWLAPLLANRILSVLLFPAVYFSLLVLSLLLLARYRRNRPRKVKALPDLEVLLALPLCVLSIWLANVFAQGIESYALGISFREFLLSAFSAELDQRNSIVVGIALGFAIIPIIFTISEDAITLVPKNLRAASLALGATRLQTALKVILPAASPGIFSAIMLGLGRAMGETMIVLMATGNTPLFDFGPWNGFRALSANIAVEMPEAPQGGSLYRVLFLSALILFLISFVINTLTEFIRRRLRKRYS